MTFQGDTIIGKPTLTMVEIYVSEKGLYSEAKDIYDYWEKRKWLTQKGVELKTLESAINTYNGMAVLKARKENKKRKKERIRQLSTMKPELEKFMELHQIKPNKKEITSYDKQLKDKRWQSFRKFVFDVRGKTCEMCGSKDHLQIHHPKYLYGRNAWEYTCNEVVVLCGTCHRLIHSIK